MSAAEIPARPGRELEAARTDRAASLICRGHLDAHGVPRLRVAIDAALGRPNVLVYLDLVDVTAAGYPVRPCAPPAGPSATFPALVSHRHPVWAIPAAEPAATMGE